MEINKNKCPCEVYFALKELVEAREFLLKNPDSRFVIDSMPARWERAKQALAKVEGKVSSE